MNKKKRDYSLTNILSYLGRPNKEKGEEFSYKKEDAIVRFHRKIASYFTKIIFDYSFITPNRISWFGLLITLLSAIFLSLAGRDIVLLAITCFFIWISAIIDCIDGQLARMRKMTSKRGEWFDAVLEASRGYSYWIAVGFNLNSLGIKPFGFDVWFLVAIVLGSLYFIAPMALYSEKLFKESKPVSHGHVYIAIFFTIFHLLDWFLILFSVASLLAIIYTLLEKSFLLSEEDKKIVNEK